jgi:hypothetical protein
LGHDQASKKEDKQVTPDKGSKLSHAHIEHAIHAAAQQNASREGNSNGEILGPVLNIGQLRETIVLF